MAVISSFVAKMPLTKDGKRSRIEFELQRDGALYIVLFFQYVSGVLRKCQLVVSTSDKKYAMQCYVEQINNAANFL